MKENPRVTPERLEDRIFASLALAGMGDALGAPTEQWTIAEIFAAHGGLVARFVDPPPDTFAGANGGLRTPDAGSLADVHHPSAGIRCTRSATPEGNCSGSPTRSGRAAGCCSW